LALDAPKAILGHVRLGLGNVHHLIAKVFPFLRIITTSQGSVATHTLRRKNLFNQIHFINGHEVSVLSFVSRLPSTRALLRFLGTPGFGLGSQGI
jgi:hypothetical protein